MQNTSKQIGDLRSKSVILRHKNTPKHSFGASGIVTYVDYRVMSRNKNPAVMPIRIIKPTAGYHTHNGG